MVGVEDDRLFLVVLAHHFHGYSIDRRLEIGLFRVDHDSDISLFGVPSDRVYASHHVLGATKIKLLANVWCLQLAYTKAYEP